MDNYDKDEHQLFNMLKKLGVPEDKLKYGTMQIMTWIDLLVRIRGREKYG